MPTLGTCVAVINEGQILLTKRRDFEVWSLPGGGLDGGESVAEGAIREVLEETGLKVELTQMIGIYSRLQGWNDGSHTVLFAAKPLTHDLLIQPSEVVEARYFHPSEIPEVLFWGHEQRIQDALNGIGGSVAYTQEHPWPFEQGTTRRDVYEMCERSNISKSDFFRTHFCQPNRNKNILEVGDENQKTS